MHLLLFFGKMHGRVAATTFAVQQWVLLRKEEGGFRAGGKERIPCLGEGGLLCLLRILKSAPSFFTGAREGKEK